MNQRIPPPPKEWTEERQWESDALAKFEVELDPLEAQIKEQDKRNRLCFKKHTGRLIVWTSYLLWILFAAGLAVWVWHYVTPYEFLSAEQLTKLQSIIFSGALGAVVSTLAKNYTEA